MIMSLMKFSTMASATMTLAMLGLQLPADAQSLPKRETPAAALARKADIAAKERINAWTVGLAGGFIEGAPLRLAAEIARVVNEQDKLHVIPIVTQGATENVNSLLYLRGIDAAIINTDALDEYKAQMPFIEQRIVYILSLFPSELHIFVRPEIRSLDDLRGKKVNFNTQGTAAAYSGPLIFSRLGLNVDKMFIPHQVALEQMKRGEVSAVVFVTSKPVDAFLKGRWDPGFKFLPVEYDTKFEDYYLPSSIEAKDYPSLVPPSPPSLRPTTGLNSPTDTGAWRASWITCSVASTDCSLPASIRSGRKSTCAPRCPVSSGSGRRSNGLIVRRP
jgi:NMT1-like family